MVSVRMDERVSEQATSATALQIRDLALWYGQFQAIRHVTMVIPERCVTALIGPSGCGKSDMLRCMNRMNDLIPGKSQGPGAVRRDERVRPGADAVEVRRRIGMVFQKPNPFPKSIYDNVAFGPRVNGFSAATSTRSSSNFAERRPGMRSRGQPSQERARHLGRPAAAALHRPHPGNRPGGRADGRAGLGARPNRDVQDRRADDRAQAQLHHRRRDLQHAAGFPRLGLHRLHACRRGAHRELVEFGETRGLFTNPATSAPRITSWVGSARPCRWRTRHRLRLRQEPWRDRHRSNAGRWRRS